MNILLTGSTGFLGSRVLSHLEQEGHDVSCIPSDIVRAPQTPEHSVALERFFIQMRPHVLVHTAAIADTGYAERHPEESYQANVELSLILARLARSYKVKLVSCSSDQVYNASRSGEPNREDQTPEPQNVYGRHKLLAETLMQEICPDAVHLRLTWMYDLPLYRQRTNGNIVLNLLKTAGMGQAARYSTGDWRGLTYVRAVAERLSQTFDLPGGAYNFGSENNLNMHDTAVDFFGAMGLASRTDELIVSDSNQERRNLGIDCSKIREHGIEFPSTTEGIRQLVADYPGMFQ